MNDEQKSAEIKKKIRNEFIKEMLNSRKYSNENKSEEEKTAKRKLEMTKYSLQLFISGFNRGVVTFVTFG